VDGADGVANLLLGESAEAQGFQFFQPGAEIVGSVRFARVCDLLATEVDAAGVQARCRANRTVIGWIGWAA
jgi:hypothetical protein